MTGKEIIRKLMENKGIRNRDMANGLNITQAALWDRLNTAKTNNMTVEKLNSMLRILGYDLVIVPHGTTAKMADCYVVEDGETERSMDMPTYHPEGEARRLADDVFTLISDHLEGGTLHLPSVFDYQDDFSLFAGIIGAANKKGVTLVFDNEGEVFEPTDEMSTEVAGARMMAWAGYFSLNKLHAQHYIDYLTEKMTKNEPILKD